MARSLAALVLGALFIVAAVASWHRGVETSIQDLSDLGLGATEMTSYSGPWLTLAAICAAAGALLLIRAVFGFTRRM